MTPNRAYNLRAGIVQNLRERGHSIREVQAILLLRSPQRVRELEARARRAGAKGRAMNAAAPVSLVTVTAADRAAWVAASDAFHRGDRNLGPAHDRASYKIAEYVADLKAQVLAHDRAKSELFELVREAAAHLRGPLATAKQIHVYAAEARADIVNLRAENARLRNELARANATP